MVLDLLTGEMSLFRIQDFTAAFYHLTLALAARPFTAASRRQIDALFGQRGKQTVALRYRNNLVAIDSDVHVPARRQIFFGNQQDDDQEENRDEEYANARINKIHIHCSIPFLLNT